MNRQDFDKWLKKVGVHFDTIGGYNWKLGADAAYNLLLKEIDGLYGKLEYAMKGYPEHEKQLMEVQIKLLTSLTENQSKEISEKDGEIKGYKEWADDVKRLTKEIDQMMNGSDAAEQASLCDIVSQMRNDATKFQERNISIAMMEEEIERQKRISDTAFREIDRLNNIIKYSNPQKDNQL